MVDFIREDIKKMYEEKKLITVCITSWEDFIVGKSSVLEHKIKGLWIKMEPPIKDYSNYSHGICPYHHNLIRGSRKK